MLKLICIAGGVLNGIGAAANGLFMLLAPARWYMTIPGVTMTGPFNEHFVRDVGLSFLLVGLSFIIGARNPQQRLALWGASSLWLFGHAAFHLWEIAAGISAHSAITRDFAPVTLPAVAGVALTLWAAESAGSDPVPH